MIRLFAWLTPAVIGSIATRVMLSLGVGVVSYVGMQELMNWVFSYVQNYLGGLPERALMLAGVAKADVAFNIIVSAVNISLLFFVAKRFRAS